MRKYFNWEMKYSLVCWLLIRSLASQPKYASLTVTGKETNRKIYLLKMLILPSPTCLPMLLTNQWCCRRTVGSQGAGDPRLRVSRSVCVCTGGLGIGRFTDVFIQAKEWRHVIRNTNSINTVWMKTYFSALLWLHLLSLGLLRSFSVFYTHVTPLLLFNLLLLLKPFTVQKIYFVSTHILLKTLGNKR